MRLLNTKTLELIEVAEEVAPEYAILSHTWGTNEASLQDILATSSRRPWHNALSQTATAIKAKSGYVKIKQSASLAAQHGLHYIWIDTCCIDKTSSAELSEAINSMYRWYQKAAVCYAYLQDVEQGYYDDKSGVFHCLCEHSRWFCRGWTLQELIAPNDVMFYGADWGFLGSKKEHEDVRISLASITGIDLRILEGIIQPSDMSIASRMKWAAHRETTRLEDQAYSLMGLFDVNMPLLYGEGGPKAFIRLQEEILKNSTDNSIFIWKIPQPNQGKQLWGLLAETPKAFADVGDYRPLPPAVSGGSTAWTTTNQGLRLSLFLKPVGDEYDHGIKANEYYAVLECAKRRGDGWSESPAIHLQQLHGDQFARINPDRVHIVSTPSYDPVHDASSYKVIFVKQKPVYAIPDLMVSFENLKQMTTSKSPLVYITGVWPPQYWDAETAILRSTPSEGSHRVIRLFRFHCPKTGANLDLAVVLERNPDGTWISQILNRASEDDSLRNAVKSVIKYLAQNQVSFPFLGETTWNVGADTFGHIRIQVHEATFHGRLYHFIKGSSAGQMQSQKTPAPQEMSTLYNITP